MLIQLEPGLIDFKLKSARQRKDDQPHSKGQDVSLIQRVNLEALRTNLRAPIKRNFNLPKGRSAPSVFCAGGKAVGQKRGTFYTWALQSHSFYNAHGDVEQKSSLHGEPLVAHGDMGLMHQPF